jgi:hypothetical protein
MTADVAFNITQPDTHSVDRELLPLPQRPDRVFLDVTAAIAVAHDESHAVGSNERARHGADDLRDTHDVRRSGQFLQDERQILS